MIKVTKLNKDEVFVNPDLIELVEANPDTALVMQGGKRMVVRETVDDVIREILKYKKYVHSSITIRKPE